MAIEISSAAGARGIRQRVLLLAPHLQRNASVKQRQARMKIISRRCLVIERHILLSGQGGGSGFKGAAVGEYACPKASVPPLLRPVSLNSRRRMRRDAEIRRLADDASASVAGEAALYRMRVAVA